jgi:hypothetical protein
VSPVTMCVKQNTSTSSGSMSKTEEIERGGYDGTSLAACHHISSQPRETIRLLSWQFHGPVSKGWILSAGLGI